MFQFKYFLFYDIPYKDDFMSLNKIKLRLVLEYIINLLKGHFNS